MEDCSAVTDREGSGMAAASTLADMELLRGVVGAVEEAGRRLQERFSPESRPADGAALIAAVAANDAVSTAVLRPALVALRPGVRWLERGDGDERIPAGEWWVVDACEGNVNHVHGMDDWGVVATLVRDAVPVLTAVAMPAWGETYTAVCGSGAHSGTRLLRVSCKSGLRAALVSTAQAKPDEGPQARRRHGRSATAMLETALLVRMAVPTTVELVRVAAGHLDGFWQFSDVRSGLMAGALLVAEAGGIVTDARGLPWTSGSDSIVAAGPGVHESMVVALGGVA